MRSLVIGGVEYDTETTQKGTAFRYIGIPKGWRLWKASDFERFTPKEWEKLNLVSDWFFIEQFSQYWKEKNYIARFSADSGGADLNCYWGPQYSDAALGARFCRDVKKSLFRKKPREKTGGKQ